MEIHQPVKITSYKSLERKEPLVKDNSAINEFKECPKRYFWRMILGYKEKDEQPYFAWGSAIHKFAEIYSLNKDAKLATTEATRIWISKFPNGVESGKWSFYSLPRLIRSLMVLQKDIDSDLASGKFQFLAVEQPFDLELPSGRRLGGRADRIDRWNNKIWGRDWKTTSTELGYYERGLDPNSQVDIYTWAETKLLGGDPSNPNSERVFGQLITVIFNKAPTKSQTSEAQIGPIIKTFVASRTPGQIERFVKETEQWLDWIDFCRQVDIYPQNERKCKWCPYARVCRAPNEDSQIAELKSNFTHSPWDHTRVEQEE